MRVFTHKHALVELTSCRHGATCWDQLEGVKLSPRSFHLLGDWEGVTTLRPHRAWGGLEGPDTGCGASSGPGPVMRVLAVTGRPWPREEPLGWEAQVSRPLRETPAETPTDSLPGVDWLCPPGPHLPCYLLSGKQKRTPGRSRAQTAIVKRELRCCFKTLNLKKNYSRNMSWIKM